MKVQLILMLSLLTSSATFAAEPDCNAEDCSQNLVKGKPAPYSGILISYPLAAANNEKLIADRKLLEEANQHCDKRVQIEKDRGTSLVDVEKQAAQLREAALLRNLEEEKSRSSALLKQANDAETSSILWGAGGLGLGIVMGVVATVAVGVYVAVTADQVPASP